MNRFTFKIGLTDPVLVKDFLEKLSMISLFLSLILIFIEIPVKFKLIAGVTFLLLLVFLYFLLWFLANTIKQKTLRINNSTIKIKEGDLFQEPGLKVIPFNEYFDTEVNNRLISDRTLNGIFIKKYIENPKKLDDLIAQNPYVQRKVVDMNEQRVEGKSVRYRLGTVYKYEQFLLTAFTRFDQENRAYLQLEDLLDFLMNFWKEVDGVYNGETIVLPLIGSGMTRFKEQDLSEQELLELLLWTFKISRLKLIEPSSLTIIIHPSRIQKINLYRLEDTILKNN